MSELNLERLFEAIDELKKERTQYLAGFGGFKIVEDPLLLPEDMVIHVGKRMYAEIMQATSRKEAEGEINR